MTRRTIMRIEHWTPGKRLGFAPGVIIDSYSRNPVVSPIDGREIASRAELREHNRRNDVEDIGNDAAFLKPKEFVDPSHDLEQDLSDIYDKFEQNDPGVEKIVKDYEHHA